ncbi:MAG TPA: macro domain-containing protein [Gemmatimonadales bacterium]|nr:macro domain-containing protein [Gemmatimonadales bacterium]
MIRVVVGDLARMSVDAVIRPADAALASTGAAGARLDEAGGDRFAAQRRTATPLEAGAAVVTGGGDLPAAFVLHVVIADERGPADRDRIRRALVSAWQRAGDWGLRRVATPLVGVAGGRLTMEESVRLLIETFPGEGAEGGPAELQIVVDAAAERDAAEDLVRRMA